MSDSDVSFAKSSFASALSGFGTKTTAAPIQPRRKAEKAAARTKPRAPGSKGKKNSTIGFRCVTRTKMIALQIQEEIGAATISDALEHLILQEGARRGIKHAKEMLADISGDEGE